MPGESDCSLSVGSVRISEGGGRGHRVSRNRERKGELPAAKGEHNSSGQVGRALRRSANRASYVREYHTG